MSLHRRFSFGLSVTVAVVGILATALPSHAIPVLSPWGDDTVPKAIIFTGPAVPKSGSGRGLETISYGDGSNTDSGIVMKAVGDGSYACTAAVFAGAQYSYWFTWRLSTTAWDGTDSYASFTDPTVNDRQQDQNRSRTITIPAGATDGYYVYNAWGDKTVIGYQSPDGDTNVISTLNPYLATIRDTPGTPRISSAGDTIFANMDGTNAYNLSAVQVDDTSFVIQWKFTLGNNGFVPPVDASEMTDFGGSGNPGSKRYGWRILRADSPTSGFLGANFVDITANVIGDTNYWDNVGTPYDGNGVQQFTDTSFYDTVATALYTVVFYNAYEYDQTDTTRQNFSGGYDTATRGAPIKVFFIVEGYREDVVFPGERDTGRVYLTPYINGVRRPDLKIPATAIRVRRTATI